jgi:hypothetical protein
MKSGLLFSFILLSTFSISGSIIAKEFKGAEYRTKDAYKYGRFEVSLKSAHREGMLSSFFTYFDGTTEDPWSSSKWNEIDLEIMGRYDDNVQFNTITPGQVNHVGHLPIKFSPHLDFHTYAFEWTPDYVAWFVDGVEVLRQMGPHIESLSRPQKIMMNVWNPQFENWAGVFNPATLPAFAYYDWVSYYEYAPGSGNYGTGNNFIHSWADNFDSWDTIRWEKGTHTFPGNGCDFIEENAVFRDGMLILCLTNSTNIGYADVTVPSVLWARSNSANKVTVMFSEEVDKTNAENISKYYITSSGVSITNAILNTDLKSVDLTVNGFDLNISNLLIVYSIKDRAEIPNSSVTQAKSIIMSRSLNFPVKINCGGIAQLDYFADVVWNPNNEYGYMDGNTFEFPSQEISNTDEDIIYQSKRFNLVGYKIRIPNGNYNIKLMFAENDYDSEDKRIFDVYLEQNLVIENLDIYQQAGKNSALIKEFTDVQVNDEVLDIQFADKVNSAMINGIVITANTTDVNDENDLGLKTFKVEQNYPNPFNGKTVINYYLPFSSNISFGLYNLLGEQIFFKDLGFKPEGNHQYLLDTFALKELPLSSGIYFYTISTFNRTEIRKMVLIN